MCFSVYLMCCFIVSALNFSLFISRSILQKLSQMNVWGRETLPTTTTFCTLTKYILIKIGRVTLLSLPSLIYLNALERLGNCNPAILFCSHLSETLMCLSPFQCLINNSQMEVFFYVTGNQQKC